MKGKTLGLFFLLYTFFPVKSVYAAIYINEIYPKTEDISKQWVELYNSGDESVSLDRWKLENSSGEITSFTFNASALIQPKSFLLFYQTQTGINLNKSGDSVKLTDEKNNLIDQQRYEGILGYNMSVGKSNDGGFGWSVCTVATPDKPNNCPAPTNTPIPPTLFPTDTPKPSEIPPSIIPSMATEIPVSEAPIPDSISTIAPDIPLLATAGSETQSFNMTTIGVIALVISILWIGILGLVYLHKRIKHRTF